MTPYSQKNSNVINYKVQEILSARPGQLTLFLYDHAVRGCKKRDEAKAVAALVQLIDSLNFEYEEIAAALFNLYEYSIRRIKAGDFDLPLRILSELRETWAQAVSVSAQESGERRIAAVG